MAKGIKRLLQQVTTEVDQEIASFAEQDSGFYSGGLASEGYNGGYLQCLQDVLLALNGVVPNRHSWWKRAVEKIEKKKKE